MELIKKLVSSFRRADAGDIVRRLIISWLTAAAAGLMTSPKESASLDGLLWLDTIDPIAFIAIAVMMFILLTFLRTILIEKKARTAGAHDTAAANGENDAAYIAAHGTDAADDTEDDIAANDAEAVTTDGAVGDPSPEAVAEGRRYADRIERFIMMGVFCVLAMFSLFVSFSVSFAVVCVLLAGAFYVYTEFGSDKSDRIRTPAPKGSLTCAVTVGVIAVVFVVLDGVWTVCRIKGFSTPTFDFGIFAQMFHYMKETGIPYTTVERDGLLSHFAVHVSPIYYLMLPFYMIFPYPGTIQVLQAAVLASAVIPLWKICRLHGLSDIQRTILCVLFLFYPAIAGGTSYDIHENCFLAPLVLWLLYGIDKKSVPIISVSLVLTLAVKEDAAVYCAVVALYIIVRALVRDHDRRDLLTGFAVLFVSLLWFELASVYLTRFGDGTLANDRYPNFLVGDTSPLVTIVKTAIICPMKLVYECVDAEKLTFLAQTILPLLALPLITRRYERYILLLPYVIVNLVSDYQYLHDIFFQYVFGTAALLFYLTAVNLADIKIDRYRVSAGVAACAVTAVFFCSFVVPKAYSYSMNAIQNKEYYDGLRDTLDIIPDDASVTATTFYTTYLSDRDELYDVRYSSEEHMLASDYIVIDIGDKSSLSKYGGDRVLEMKLLRRGYEKCAEYGQYVKIYKKASAE